MCSAPFSYVCVCVCLCVTGEGGILSCELAFTVRLSPSSCIHPPSPPQFFSSL